VVPGKSRPVVRGPPAIAGFLADELALAITVTIRPALESAEQHEFEFSLDHRREQRLGGRLGVREGLMAKEDGGDEGPGYPRESLLVERDFPHTFVPTTMSPAVAK